MFRVKLRASVPQPEALLDLVNILHEFFLARNGKVAKISSGTLVASVGGVLVKIGIVHSGIDVVARIGMPQLVLVIALESDEPTKLVEVLQSMLEAVRSRGTVKIELEV